MWFCRAEKWNPCWLRESGETGSTTGADDTSFTSPHTAAPLLPSACLQRRCNKTFKVYHDMLTVMLFMKKMKHAGNALLREFNLSGQFTVTVAFHSSVLPFCATLPTYPYFPTWTVPPLTWARCLMDVNKSLQPGQASVEHGFGLSRAAGKTYNVTTQGVYFTVQALWIEGTMPVSLSLAWGGTFFSSLKSLGTFRTSYWWAVDWLIDDFVCYGVAKAVWGLHSLIHTYTHTQKQYL